MINGDCRSCSTWEFDGEYSARDLLVKFALISYADDTTDSLERVADVTQCDGHVESRIDKEMLFKFEIHLRHKGMSKKKTSHTDSHF